MGIEFENKDDQQVSQVLSTLSHVEPPGDFDVRVRSRIAAGKPAETRSWFWPLLAGAAPLALLLVIGAYFVLRTEPTSSPTVASAPVVEQVTVPTSANNVAPVVANNVSILVLNQVQ